MTSYAELKRRKNARKNRPRQPGSTLPRASASKRSETPKSSLPGTLKKTKTKGTKGRGKKPPRKVNSKRKAREFARCYHSKRRVAFVKSLGCFVCRELHPWLGEATVGRCDNAHTEVDGAGRKAGYHTIIPLCRVHHRCYDERKPPFHLDQTRDGAREIAAIVERGWQEHQRRAA